ncbi:MAG: AmmeMemoRadiSam system protein A [Nitrospinota bacterium]|nr:AmmeMemoRadiSam system protein A [Nitrospinota bacterium]
MNLSDEDKRTLLKLARGVIESRAMGDKAPTPPKTASPTLESKAGVFVSLHSVGALRGCVGYIQPDMSLLEGVQRSAANAAFDDSRFAPVGRDEVSDLEIEISLLTPPSPVESYDMIEIGKHGIILEKGGARALFLPQVATENDWDLPTTLTFLARKAGLAPDSWREGASFQVFESIVFSEKDL